MTIDIDLWPMNLITKPVGSKDRKLIIHPKDAIKRAGISRNKNNELYIKDISCVKIPNGIYIPEDKEEGHRHIYCRDSDGEYHMYGRRLNVNQTYTDIWKEKGLYKFSSSDNLGFPILPKESALDLELCWPGHPDSEVATAIKDHPEELHPYFFAILIWKGNLIIGENSPSWFNGRRALNKIVNKEFMTKGYKPIEINNDNKYDVLNMLMNLAESKGKEGFVLKSLFVDDWWKIKGINEGDVFVTGFKVSNSETRMGLITGVTIGVLDDNYKIVDMGKISGFDLEEINSMTKEYNKYGDSNKNKYMYRTCRVIYQQIAGKGKLKHGFFDCWRDNEKNMRECTMDQFNK